MIKLLRSRGASAVIGAFILALASGEANAQSVAVSDVAAAVAATSVDGTATPLGVRAASAAGTVSAIYATKAAQSVTVSLPTASVAAAAANAASVAGPDIAREAAWLHANGWPLYALVDRYGATAAEAPLTEEANCMAVAVYHEARGESVEGQLAVARVIMNRAASGKYPSTWCGTVKQPWQFSFVNARSGAFPYTDKNCAAWRKAVAITKLAMANAVPTLSTDVLWYHADYVAPSWGRRLTRAEKIGTHIFYRS